MLRLRTYKACDAKTILTWCKDEISFRKWTSDRYESFPITEEEMNRKYIDCNGDCAESDNFYPMTAFDESGAVCGISVLTIGETPGLGTKVQDKAYLDSFKGITSPDFQADAITGATYSSKGMNNAVQTAARAYSQLKEEQGNG